MSVKVKVITKVRYLHDELALCIIEIGSMFYMLRGHDMQCSDTSAKLPAVHIAMPVDLAKDISYYLEAIKAIGGNGRITLFVSGGNVVDSEITAKPKRNKKSA